MWFTHEGVTAHIVLSVKEESTLCYLEEGRRKEWEEKKVTQVYSGKPSSNLLNRADKKIHIVTTVLVSVGVFVLHIIIKGA